MLNFNINIEQDQFLLVFNWAIWTPIHHQHRSLIYKLENITQLLLPASSSRFRYLTNPRQGQHSHNGLCLWPKHRFMSSPEGCRPPREQCPSISGWSRWICSTFSCWRTGEGSAATTNRPVKDLSICSNRHRKKTLRGGHNTACLKMDKDRV